MGDVDSTPAELQAVGLEWLRKATVSEDEWQRSWMRAESQGTVEHEAAHSAQLTAYAHLAQANFQAANIALLLGFAERNADNLVSITAIGDETNG